MKKILLGLTLFTAIGAQQVTRAQYCTPVYTDNCMWGDDIDDFVITSGGINHLGTGCSGGYGDYSSTPGLVGNLQSTVSYNFSVTHNFSNQYVRIWIDFNNDFTFDNVTELLFQSSGGASNTTGSILIPAVTPINGVRMRVMGNYAGIMSDACTGSYYGETHDYTVNILPPPPCPNPMALSLIDVTAFTAIVGWTEPGTATDYVTEWGLPGFAPGTGAEIGTANVSGATNYEMTSLTPATTYDFYVRADCGVDGLSYWAGPFSLTTPCVPVSTLPWTEDFESVAPVGAHIFPSCWEHELVSGSGWNVHDNLWAFGDADALSGSQFLGAQYGSESYLWTPEFEMIGGETYEFVFYWAGDLHDQWQGEVLVSASQSSVGAVTLGAPFVNSGEMTTLEYQKVIYCFTPDTNGTYSFAMHYTETGWWYYLAVDDVTVRQSLASAGTDATLDICQTEGLIDLNNLGSIIDPNGVWMFSANPSAVVQDTLLNTVVLPQGSAIAIYEHEGCLAPDVTVTLNVQIPSSAGNDGVIDACMNQQVDLLGALSGNVNLGGVWLDSNDAVLPSSYFMTGTVAGTYPYEYVATNGVCPSDTAMVTLTILPCDYLASDEMATLGASVYPNPTSGSIFMTVTNATDGYLFAVSDINGRMVIESNAIMETSTTKTLDISMLENGVYFLRVYNSEGSTVFRIVKN